MNISTIKNYYQAHPLRSILFVALLIRLVAVIFSKGYGMMDDHFLIIEPARAFLYGYDYNKWLPSSSDVPSGHSMFYVGLNYLFFVLTQFIGLEDPQGIMYLVRAVHAIYSLSIVYFGYRIAARITTSTNTKYIAWVLALLWFFPNFSVRNLVEFVCIPPLMLSAICLLNFEEGRFKNEKNIIRFAMLSGLLIGLSTGIRYQCAFFAFGTGLYFLIRKEWFAVVFFSTAWFLAFFLTQATDLFLWKRPFAELIAYAEYNIENAEGYFTSPFYNYVLTVGGMLIPPFSLLLFFGFFRNINKHLVLFLPAFLFFIFHSYFPNKQERFILPFIPFFVILGIAGWEEFNKSKNWEKFGRISWRFFWVLNTILVFAFSTFYSKRAFVESMYFLFEQKDYKSFHYDCSYKDSMSWPPEFYAGSHNAYSYTIDSENQRIEDRVRPFMTHDGDTTKYILFQDKKDLGGRLDRFERAHQSKLSLLKVIEPSWIDYFLHWLNHHNKCFEVYIYKAS